MAKLDDGGERRRFPMRALGDSPIHNFQRVDATGYLVCLEPNRKQIIDSYKRSNGHSSGGRLSLKFSNLHAQILNEDATKSSLKGKKLISFLGIFLMIVQDPVETEKLAVVLAELIICNSTKQSSSSAY